MIAHPPIARLLVPKGFLMGLSYGLGYSHAVMKTVLRPCTHRPLCPPAPPPPQSPERAAARRERGARGPRAAMSIEEEGRKRSSKRPAPQMSR